MTGTQQQAEVAPFQIKVKNITFDANQEEVEAFLKTFTSVQSVKLLVNPRNNRSKGYAYATLADQAALDKALNHQDLDLKGRKVQIVQARPQGEKAQQQEQNKQNQTSLYVGNLAADTTEEQLKSFFNDVKEVKILTGRRDQTQRFAFVEFNSSEAVQVAVQQDGKQLGGNEIKVDFRRQRRQVRQRRFNNRQGGQTRQGGQDRQDRQQRRPQNNSDRNYERSYDRPRQERRRNESSSIYIGNLDFHTDEQTLREVFAEFDEITEVRVVRDRETDRSKGYGFLTFASSEGARRALRVDGEEVDGRSIKVDVQQSRPGQRRPNRGGQGYGQRNNDYSRRKQSGERGYGRPRGRGGQGQGQRQERSENNRN